MATVAAHANQVNHNEAFRNTIDPSLFPDWVVTAAFYQAVHMAEGLLVRKGRASGSHVVRNGILKRHFPTVWVHYRPLYNQSRVARYLCVPIAATAVAQATARLQATAAACAAVP